MDRNYWILAGAGAAFALFVFVQRGPVADASTSLEDAASRAKTSVAARLGTSAMRQQAAAEAPAQTTGTAPTTIPADDFVRAVAISDMFEIQSSRLAKDRLGLPGKTFADHMMLAHMKTTSELTGLSGSAKFKAEIPTALDDAHRQRLDQLRALNDQEFKDTYRKMQVQAHQDAIELFTAYAQRGDNADLKQWASETLPDLKDHLAMAQSMK